MPSHRPSIAPRCLPFRLPNPRRTAVALSLAVGLLCLVASPASAGPTAKAAREAAEYLMRKFGREVASESAEKLTTRIEAVALRHGDEAISAVRRTGPRGLRAVERAAGNGGDVARLLSRQGDEALWIVENPKRLSLFLNHGDEAASAMLKHKGLAEPLIETFKQPAAQALSSLGGQNARRLSMMAADGELAALGRSGPLLSTIARYGDKGMDFVWRNKKALAVAGVLATFLADPQPFIDGTRDLATGLVRPLAESVGREAARRADWTWLGVTGLLVVSGYLAFRFWLRERTRRLARAQ